MKVDSSTKTVERIVAEFARTTDQIVSLDEFRRLLGSGRQLKFKYGVDVTAPTIHIGHAVNLWLYRILQDVGHKVVFLVGDFTTKIGDPTGKSATRPVITDEEIEENSQAFIHQAKIVLREDPELVEVRRNSEWFGKMPVSEFLSLLSIVTHDRLAGRDMFKKRIEEGREIYMHEMIYPVLQAYDSVYLRTDMTIIGSDQLYNEMLGRTFQEKFGQAPQVIVTTKITPGIDGRDKQSKSLGNYIGLAHDAREKFGRVMSIPDSLLASYFEVYTTVKMEEVHILTDSSQTPPRDAKLRLAEAIVARYHGENAARAERDWFIRTFSAKETPDDIPEVAFGAGTATAFDAVRLCLDRSMSNSEIRRLFSQSAITAGGKVLAPEDKLRFPAELKIGKRRWFKVLP